MFQMLYESLRGRALRSFVALATLLGVAGGLGLHLSAAQATTATVAQILDLQRSSGYDILVRPAGTRTRVERTLGLLEPHHLLGIPGGITFDQYAAIRDLSGVEVAAPIANLGYYRQPLYIWFGDYDRSGVYAVSCRIEEAFGPRTRSEEEITYRWVGPAAEPPEQEALGELGIEPDLLSPVCVYAYAFSLVAIDPEQESALVGLEQAVSNDYLSRDMRVERQAYQMSSGQEVLYAIPALIHASQDFSATFTSELVPVGWPLEDGRLSDMLKQNGPEALPRQEAIASQTLDGAAGYQMLLSGLVGRGGRRFNLPQFSRWALPATVPYRPYEDAEVDLPAPLVEAGPVGAAGEGDPEDLVPIFRAVEPERLTSGVLYRVVGTYDPGRVPTVQDVPLPPSSVYSLTEAVWRYDAQGQPVDPQPLRPGLEPGAYLQGPPTVLTTLEAARLLGGEAAIGAIRVRVGGVETLSPEGLARVEAVAAEIRRQTGLDVDVIAGASPREVTVRIPGYGDAPPLGYLEETWTELGVGRAFHPAVVEVAGRWAGPLAALYGLLALGALPALLAGRVGDLRLLLEFGWRRGAVVRYALLESTVGGLLSGLLGIGVALALAARYDLGRLAERTWVIIPLAVGVGLLGGLYMAARALWGARPARRSRRRPAGGHIWWAPTASASLTLLVALAGAALVVAMQGASTGLSARLRGSDLGDFVATHLSTPRDVVLATTLATAALGVAGASLGRALARRTEIGLLAALGWRTEAVALRVGLEHVLLALVGGLLGALLGGALAVRAYGAAPESLVWPAAFAVGGQVLAAALAGGYGALLATRVAPAESSRPR